MNKQNVIDKIAGYTYWSGYDEAMMDGMQYRCWKIFRSSRFDSKHFIEDNSIKEIALTIQSCVRELVES